MDTADFAATAAAAFDLVVLCDVLHHATVDERAPLVRTARRLTRPGGALVVKDWDLDRDLATLAGYLSDRYITGDHVQFFPPGALEALVTAACPGDPIVAEGRVPPRRNNHYFVVQAGCPLETEPSQ
jgi:SAM-dependent methyltransferase